MIKSITAAIADEYVVIYMVYIEKNKRHFVAIMKNIGDENFPIIRVAVAVNGADGLKKAKVTKISSPERDVKFTSGAKSKFKERAISIVSKTLQ